MTPGTARDRRLDRFLSLQQLAALKRVLETGELPPVRYCRPRYDHKRLAHVVRSDDGVERFFDTEEEAQAFYDSHASWSDNGGSHVV